MATYRLFTDAACDVPKAMLSDWGVSMIEMTYRFTDEADERCSGETDMHDLYEQMRAGRCSRTAAVNMQTFLNAFRPALEAGEDVVYLAFSSGGSTTYEQSLAAVHKLQKQFPERKIVSVDTLSFSGGFGLLVYLTAKKQREGATLEEIVRYVEETRLHICHWFTVEDLVYLKRGGRISATTAIVGAMLGIKPVLHVDDTGHLVSVSKARSRRRSLKALVDAYEKTAVDKEHGTVFIFHGDSPEDAKLVEEMVGEVSGGRSVDLIHFIGPIIGSHSGPGTMALFFVGTER